MKKKVYFCTKDSFNYELNENEYTGTLLEEERRKKLKDYLMKNPFNIGSLGYIFCEKYYYRSTDIVSEEI